MYRRFLGFLFIASLVLAIFAYPDFIYPNQDSDKIEIGAALPYTGPSSDITASMDELHELVEWEVEQAGGINGSELEITGLDTRQQESEALDVANQLFNIRNVEALFGPMTTPASNAIIPVGRDAKKLMVSPSATGVRMDDVEDNGYFFLTALSDEVGARAMADEVEDRDISQVDFLVISDAWGQNYADLFEEEYEGDINKIEISATASSFRSELEEVRSSESELIVLVGYSDVAATLLQEAHQMGLSEEQWLTNDPIIGMDHIETFGQDNDGDYIMDGLQGVTPAPDSRGDGFQTFSSQYEELNGEEPPEVRFLKESYDAYAVIVLAKKHSVSNEVDIRQSVREISEEPGETVSSIEEGIEILNNGGMIHYIGASSDIQFDETGKDITGTYELREFSGGEVTTQRTIEN